MAWIVYWLSQQFDSIFIRNFVPHSVEISKSFLKTIIPRKRCVEESVHILGSESIQSVSGTVRRHVLDALYIIYFMILGFVLVTFALFGLQIGHSTIVTIYN